MNLIKVLFSAFLFVLSVVYTVLAFGFEFLQDGKPGPGFLPMVVGILLIFFTGLTLIQAIKERLTEKDLKNSGASQDGKAFFKDVIYLIILVALFVLVLRFLGGLISMILFAYGVLFIFNRGKHLQNVLTSVLIPTAVFLLFEVWLNAGIPKGILEKFI